MTLPHPSRARPAPSTGCLDAPWSFPRPGSSKLGCLAVCICTGAQTNQTGNLEIRINNTGHKGANELRETGELRDTFQRFQTAASWVTLCSQRGLWRKAAECYAGARGSCPAGSAGGLFRGGQACQPPTGGTHGTPRQGVRRRRHWHGETVERLGRCLWPEKDGLRFTLFGFLLSQGGPTPGFACVPGTPRGSPDLRCTPGSPGRRSPPLRAALQRLIADDKPRQSPSLFPGFRSKPVKTQRGLSGQ